MCDPVSASIAVLSVAGAVVGHQEQAKAFEANAKNANKSLQLDATQLNTRTAQEEQKAAQAKFDKNLEGRSALARNIASQGEAGVSLNYDAVAADIVRNVSFSNTTTDANLAMTKDSLKDELAGAKNRRTSRINEVAAPSAMASGLKIAGSVAGGFGNAQAAGTFKMGSKPPSSGVPPNFTI